MDTEVIKISILDDEKIIGLLRRMLAIKNQENKEVECELDGKLLTTLNSDNISDLLVNNSDSIFDVFEQDRLNLLETQEMKKIVHDFEDRGVDEVDTPEEAEAISKLENEFDSKIKSLSNLDFSKPVNVYEWLNSLVDYVNNIKLYIPLDREDYKYGSSANYIVQKLNENGYTTEKNPINNLDDYYRRLISYQLSDLDKYQFFAYDYADKMRDNHEILDVKKDINEIVNDDSKILEKLESEKNFLLFKLSAIDDYEKGLINRKKEKTVGFDERKRDLRLKIEQLKNSKASDAQININDDFLNANNKLKNLIMRTGSDQIKAVKFYEAAEGIPFPNNIIPALEQAALLPDGDVLKQPLIDALVKMDARYSSFKDEQSTKLMQDTMSRLGIKPYNPFSLIDNDILLLEKQIENIDNVQNKIIEAELPVRKKINERLDQIEIQMQEIINPSADIEKNTSDSNEKNSFQDKLSGIAAEGPIFVDLERRVDKRNQWMELNTAKSLNRISSENEIPVLQQDSMSIPHSIKAIKKASLSLIEKVNSLDFNKVKRNVLNWIVEHKKIALAVAVGLMVVSGYGLKSNLDDSNVVQAENFQNKSSNTVLDENEHLENSVEYKSDDVENSVNNVVDNVEISTVKTDSELAHDAIQDAINGIINGDKVFSNEYDAINNQNGLPTSKSQRENSWANSEAGAFYDNDANILTREEAEAIIASGGEVVARFDNNGIPIGFTSVGQSSNDDTSGLSK